MPYVYDDIVQQRCEKCFGFKHRCFYAAERLEDIICDIVYRSRVYSLNLRFKYTGFQVFIPKKRCCKAHFVTLREAENNHTGTRFSKMFHVSFSQFSTT